MMKINVRENLSWAVKKLADMPETTIVDSENVSQRVDLNRKAVNNNVAAILKNNAVKSEFIRTTIIAEGDIFEGTLKCGGNLEVYGEMIGDINVPGDVCLCGKVRGNVAGRNIEIVNIRVASNITAKGKMAIKGNSVVRGNIKAESMVLKGRVKGDLQITKDLILETGSAVEGTITAERISIEEGVRIQGQVNVCPNAYEIEFDLGGKYA